MGKLFTPEYKKQCVEMVLDENTVLPKCVKWCELANQPWIVGDDKFIIWLS